MQEVLPENAVIRKLWIGETGRYRGHLLRLDQESRRSRFGGAVSDETIAKHGHDCFGLDAIVHGCFIDGVLRAGAELRPLAVRRAQRAEAALSVERPWQGHGIGSALLQRTLLAARNRGYRLLHMACLVDNKRMQQLARKFDAELSFGFGSVVGKFSASRPTPLSLLRELLTDGHGVATAMLELQSRLLRA